MAQSDNGAKPDGRARRWAGHRATRRRQTVEAAVSAVDTHGADTTAEHIAAAAGIPRPQLYRYFTDTDDLHAAVTARIADELVEKVTATLTPPIDTPAAVADRAVGALVGWFAEHAARYRYVQARATPAGEGVVSSVKTCIGSSLTSLLATYADLFGVDARLAEPAAFALVGMVETTTARWLDHPGDLTREKLLQHLSSWCWCLIEELLRTVDITIDPHQPLPPAPEE